MTPYQAAGAALLTFAILAPQIVARAPDGLAPCYIARTDKGHIKRSQAAHKAFQRDNPCPATGKTKGPCPGYIVDHIIALACCGMDDPINMQWQTTADSKAKDRWELACNRSID